MLVQAFTARGHKGGISYILQELQKLKFRVKMQISQGHPGYKWQTSNPNPGSDDAKTLATLTRTPSKS
jgi:hypothetical protein